MPVYVGASFFDHLLSLFSPSNGKIDTFVPRRWMRFVDGSKAVIVFDHRFQIVQE
jgi:hypothetical protein